LKEKLSVNAVDKSKKTFLQFMCFVGKTEEAFELYMKYQDFFSFDVETKFLKEKSLMVSEF